jgi:hypothetical protein
MLTNKLNCAKDNKRGDYEIYTNNGDLERVKWVLNVVY